MSDLNMSQEVNFKDYWRVITRRAWVIICFFVVCTVTVALGTFLMTPLYKAETTILVEGENTNLLRAEESAIGSMGHNIFENYLETQMALIMSDSVAGKVKDEFLLKDTDRYKEREGLAKVFQVDFKDDIELERIAGTRMISIAVYNPDPEKAASLTNRLAEVYALDTLQRRALTFIRNQRMGSMNGEFLRLQARLDALSNQFGPKHPEMIMLRQEISMMAKRLEGQRNGSSPQQRALLPEQALLEETLRQIQESSVLSSSRMNNILIVDRAKTPRSMAKPNRMLNIALGIFIGLVYIHPD